MPTKSIFQRLFENGPQPRLVIERDKDGLFRVSLANDAACDYFSQKPGMLDGTLLDDFLDAANKEHIIHSFDVCFKTGMPVTMQVIPVLPGGVRIQSFMLNPIANDDGETDFVDMAARPAASDEDALRRERDDAMSIFASIFDAADVSIVVTDHNRRIVRVNDTLCRVYGWDVMDLIGHEFTIYVPDDEKDKARHDHDAQIEGAPMDRSRARRLARKNGEIADILVSSGVIELSGKRKFRISNYVDITNLKRIERDLRSAVAAADAASHAKSAFLANMSHELRTPLNAIIGFSDLMRSGTLGKIENEHYQEYLGDIHFSATHLLSIINDVLDMSKIEAGHMKLNVQVSDVGPLLEEVTRLMRARAQENHITLELRISEQLKPIVIDQRMFRQVLLNLLSNAVKFSPDGGKVSLNVRPEESWLVVDVRDEGIGIPADKIEEVMRPFAQVLDPRVAKGQGTGLGLPLARAMVELHGGQLSIASRLDKGTVVTCRLPLSS